ncbi:hypothetical protein T484DRAFT_3226023 [Baffinella frigidus]|nr:hypothetical protein T484DRAFT_3226023 [Cryptophyta sp. CCMP2293]
MALHAWWSGRPVLARVAARCCLSISSAGSSTPADAPPALAHAPGAAGSTARQPQGSRHAAARISTARATAGWGPGSRGWPLGLAPGTCAHMTMQRWLSSAAPASPLARRSVRFSARCFSRRRWVRAGSARSARRRSSESSVSSVTSPITMSGCSGGRRQCSGSSPSLPLPLSLSLSSSSPLMLSPSSSLSAFTPDAPSEPASNPALSLDASGFSMSGTYSSSSDSRRAARQARPREVFVGERHRRVALWPGGSTLLGELGGLREEGAVLRGRWGLLLLAVDRSVDLARQSNDGSVNLEGGRSFRHVVQRGGHETLLRVAGRLVELGAARVPAAKVLEQRLEERAVVLLAPMLARCSVLLRVHRQTVRAVSRRCRALWRQRRLLTGHGGLERRRGVAALRGVPGQRLLARAVSSISALLLLGGSFPGRLLARAVPSSIVVLLGGSVHGGSARLFGDGRGRRDRGVIAVDRSIPLARRHRGVDERVVLARRGSVRHVLQRRNTEADFRVGRQVVERDHFRVAGRLVELAASHDLVFVWKVLDQRVVRRTLLALALVLAERSVLLPVHHRVWRSAHTNAALRGDPLQRLRVAGRQVQRGACCDLVFGVFGVLVEKRVGIAPVLLLPERSILLPVHRRV